MGLASPVESLPVNGAEVGATDDEVVDGAASRDMDFKLSPPVALCLLSFGTELSLCRPVPLWSYFFMSGWLQFFTGSVGC